MCSRSPVIKCDRRPGTRISDDVYTNNVELLVLLLLLLSSSSFLLAVRRDYVEFRGVYGYTISSIRGEFFGLEAAHWVLVIVSFSMGFCFHLDLNCSCL